MIKWINQGVNLFTLHLHKVAVNKFNNTTYPTFDLSANGYSDILTAACRDTDATPDQDIEMVRISYADWLSYPNKYSTGTPLKFAVDRNAEFDSSGTANHTVYLWPGPSEDSRYEIVMWAIMYGEDITDNYQQNAAVPKRMLPALISGLTAASIIMGEIIGSSPWTITKISIFSPLISSILYIASADLSDARSWVLAVIIALPLIEII